MHRGGRRTRLCVRQGPDHRHRTRATWTATFPAPAAATRRPGARRIRRPRGPTSRRRPNPSASRSSTSRSTISGRIGSTSARPGFPMAPSRTARPPSRTSAPTTSGWRTPSSYRAGRPGASADPQHLPRAVRWRGAGAGHPRVRRHGARRREPSSRSATSSSSSRGPTTAHRLASVHAVRRPVLDRARAQPRAGASRRDRRDRARRPRGPAVLPGRRREPTRRSAHRRAARPDLDPHRPGRPDPPDDVPGRPGHRGRGPAGRGARDADPRPDGRRSRRGRSVGGGALRVLRATDHR